MNKTIILREYWTLGYNEKTGDRHKSVSEGDWKEIRDFVLNNPDQQGRPVMDVRADHIRTENYVGVIQTSRGRTIEILPKIDLDQGEDTNREREIFLQMLRRWRDGPYREFNDADIRSLKNFPILEAFITMFLKDILELTRRGLACSYNEVEENRHYLKGKLLMAQHLRHNLVHKERFYVRFEEFSANRPINRLLKSTLLLLQRLSRSETNLAHIRQARFYFDEIPESKNVDADLARARVDRTMPLYSRLFPWVRLFLKRAAPATWRDRTPAVALLFPMEKIFEDYVAYLLRLGSGWDISTQDVGCHLIEKNPDDKPEFRLRPDIVAQRTTNYGKIMRVMDTKWKHLDSRERHHKISQSDLYQLYAYGKKYHAPGEAAPELYLLYPENQHFKEPLRFQYDGELKLTAWPVDLSKEEALKIDETPYSSQTAA